MLTSVRNTSRGAIKTSPIGFFSSMFEVTLRPNRCQRTGLGPLGPVGGHPAVTKYTRAEVRWRSAGFQPALRYVTEFMPKGTKALPRIKFSACFHRSHRYVSCMIRRTKSDQLFAEALKHIPGGVNSPV